MKADDEKHPRSHALDFKATFLRHEIPKGPAFTTWINQLKEEMETERARTTRRILVRGILMFLLWMFLTPFFHH